MFLLAGWNNGTTAGRGSIMNGVVTLKPSLCMASSWRSVFLSAIGRFSVDKKCRAGRDSDVLLSDPSRHVRAVVASSSRATVSRPHLCIDDH
jgi:hypothetical protein